MNLDTQIITRSYYGVYTEPGRSAGSQRVAMRENDTLFYLLGDHLGSTGLTLDANGNKVAEQRYKPWGEIRFSSGLQVTDYAFTGQRDRSYIGLIQMGSRWYDPALGRFIQPDVMVPGAGIPMAFDRYMFVFSNPIIYIDNSGHFPVIITVGIIGTLLGYFPDYRGIQTAERIVPRGSDIDGVDSVLVTAGIAVQSQWYDSFRDSRESPIYNDSRGIGPAQVSDQQMNTSISDGGYGLVGVDQTTDEGAALAMARRIRLVWDQCSSRSSCTSEDLLIAAAFAQNGSGFSASDMKNVPIKNGSLDWESYIQSRGTPSSITAQIRQNVTGLQYDTQFMLLLYLNDLRELHKRGWELPFGLTLNDLDRIQKKYIDDLNYESR